MLTIGAPAYLLPGGSVHREDFLAAAAWGRAYLQRKLGTDVRILFRDDGASQAGGQRAAKWLSARGVDAVVGHFASAAARGGLAEYPTHVPVLLPAATAPDLLTRSPSAIRLCGDDTLLARGLVDWVGEEGWLVDTVTHDGSHHGRALARCLTGLLESKRTSADLTDRACVFAGSYIRSVQYVRTLRARGDRRWIVLTDDAVAPSLVADLGRAADRIRVFGFAPVDGDDRLGTVSPRGGIYYRPMCLAFEVLGVALAAGIAWDELPQSMQTRCWQTSAGTLAFVQREVASYSYGVWIPHRGALVPQAVRCVHREAVPKRATSAYV